MEDQQIIDLYWDRSEWAISETDAKYGPYCRCIAQNILRSREDSEECVNDTWLGAWNRMPTRRPDNLGAFLGRITRNLSLSRWRREHAQKRGGGQVPLVLEELAECVPAPGGGAETEERLALRELLNAFLEELGPEKRRIFLQRYWYFCPIKEIARLSGRTEGNVKMILLRARRALGDRLKKEGYTA